ncbi:acyl-CoA dehydrogenase family protein [Mycobacterium sp.]|uniref:acyl-CoA dehydrogenase family protein n=1 Tax=Mycobacterium sp. TaxID=1785 RepID=UPI003D1524E7
MTGQIGEAVRSTLDHQSQAGADWAWDESAGRSATQQLAAGGWLGVGLDGDLDGEGGDLADAVAVVDAVSSGGWPSPVADLVLVTNGVKSLAGIAADDAGLTVVVPDIGWIDDDGRVNVDADWVPWATWASQLIVIIADRNGDAGIAVIDADCAQRAPRRSLNGAPWASVIVSGAPATTLIPLRRPAEEVAEEILVCGALARSVQISSALARVQELTVEHIATRKQFGRPLSAFQAVQQSVAALAGAVTAAQAAVADATRGVSHAAQLRTDPRLATAKIQTAKAATEVAAVAHQLHGALGTAREHELHRHTLSLWTWREEFGAEHYWASRLASDALAAPDLWAWLTEDGAGVEVARVP